jgi:hypothetical protein
MMLDDFRAPSAVDVGIEHRNGIERHRRIRAMKGE